MRSTITYIQTFASPGILASCHNPYQTATLSQPNSITCNFRSHSPQGWLVPLRLRVKHSAVASSDLYSFTNLAREAISKTPCDLCREFGSYAIVFFQLVFFHKRLLATTSKICHMFFPPGV